MSLSEDDVIVGLCSRVASAYSNGDVFYHFDHCKKWPPETLDGLIKSRLLVPAPDADWIICGKCQHRCNRPIERELDGEQSNRITCELRDDVTVIPIRAERLRRWRTSQRLVSAFVGHQLGLRIQSADYKVGRVAFRSKRFDGVRASLSLEFADRRTVIKLIGNEHPLEELIVWRRGVPTMDHDEIAALVREGRSSGRTRQESSIGRKRQRENNSNRNDDWQQMANFIKAERPALGKDDIAEEIFKRRKWPGVKSHKTVARNIRVSRN